MINCALCQIVGPAQIPEGIIQEAGTVTKGVVVLPGPAPSLIMCTCYENCGSIFCWKNPNNAVHLSTTGSTPPLIDHYPHEESPVRKKFLAEFKETAEK
jgi:hypothetical protein